MEKKEYMKPSVKAICLHSMGSILLTGSDPTPLQINDDDDWEVQGVQTSGLQW